MQKNDKNQLRFSLSIPSHAGKVNKITEKYRSHTSLSHDQYIHARRLRLPPFCLEFEKISQKLNVPLDQIKIALRGIRTRNKDPKRGMLNCDRRSREIILATAKKFNEPVYKVIQRLLIESAWDKKITN